MEDSASKLPIPEPGDPNATLNTKLAALEEVVRAGKSIAFATNFIAVPSPQRDATKTAVEEMTPMEAESWKEYTAQRIRLPDIDWASNVGIAPTSEKPLRLARRRAEALNRLYNTEQASPEHVVWFVQNELVYLPLVKAMMRVIGAERNLLGGHDSADTIQVADLQTINRVLSLSGRIMEVNRGHARPSGIGQAQHVLGAQRDRLRSSLGYETTKREAAPQ